MEYTSEQLNFFRMCYITFNLVPEGLRKVFKQEWDFRYKTSALGEWKDTSQNGRDFYNNESQKSRRRIAIHLATIQEGNTAKWDCTCLLFAILNSDSIGTTMSPAVRKDVNDLRQVRNLIAHTRNIELTDALYQNYVGRVLAAFNSLKLPIDEIKNQTGLTTAEVTNILKIQADNFKSELRQTQVEIESIPSYVMTRGPEARDAYRRAKATGAILDRRVKVLLIGQDRVGKTSLGKSLLGEPFNPKEESTDGVQMHEPLKNPDIQPWNNAIMQQETTTYHHKCAEYIEIEMQAKSKARQTTQHGEELINKPSEDLHRPDIQTELPDTAMEGNPATSDAQAQADDDNIPDKIVRVISENQKAVIPDGIWPVIWDFAGQAVYRAIHPIFASREAVYVLVCDLTKDLFSTAECHVNEKEEDEDEVAAPDTNVDHIMRWMDLVHSLRHLVNGETLPPVVVVGTHAKSDKLDRTIDGVDGKKKDALDDLENFLSRYAKEFIKRIASFHRIENSLAGKPPSQEDSQICILRQEILDLADSMPHTKREVPLKWLEVENEVREHAERGVKYMKREQFKMEIVNKIYQIDIKHILHFLRDRGTIVYHDVPNNPDEGLVVLDPQWLVEVLCKIITVKKQGYDKPCILRFRQDLQDKGILDGELFDHACKNLHLENIKDSLLFIMKKFHLLCEYKNKDGKSEYLVPCMLTTKPAKDWMGPQVEGYAPVFITFSTNYVPFGLFTRLLVLFGEWAASRSSCGQPKCRANAGSFFVGKDERLDLACCKTVIKIHIWTMKDSDLVEISSEVSRILNESLKRLKQDCHWLHEVSWQLCGQCKLCQGKVDPETRKCFWHQERKCSNVDCAHYVPVDRSPFCCEDAQGHYQPYLPQTWIQAPCGNITSEEHPIAGGTHSIAESEEMLQSVVAASMPCVTQRKREAACVNDQDQLSTMNTNHAGREGSPLDERLEELSLGPPPAKVPRIAKHAVQFKTGMPGAKELDVVAGKIHKVWKSLGRRLSVDDDKLDEIELTAGKNSPYEMLRHWKNTKTPKATYDVLYEALCHERVGRNDLARTFCCQ